jgi:hypothetical protein
MLPRDISTNSYLRRYYPKIDIYHFEQDMFSPNKNNLQLVALTSEDSKRVIDSANFYLYIQAFTAVTSFLGGVIFYNKLPYFKNIQSKWARFFWKIALFLIPTYTVSGYSIYKQSQQTSELYQKYFDKYAKYKCTGNILDLNPNAKCNISS